MRYPLLLIVLFFFTLSQAQEFDDFNFLKLQIEANPFDSKEEVIEGRRYLDEEFNTGELLLRDSSFFSPIEMRYDALEDAIEMFYHGENFIIPSKEEMIYAVIGNDTVVAVQYSDKGQPTWENMFLLQGGDFSLYEKYRVSLSKAELAKPFVDARPAKYILSSGEYYWGRKGEVLERVGNKKKTELLLDNADAMIFIKKEKISLNKLEDLIKLVNYYNNIN